MLTSLTVVDLGGAEDRDSSGENLRTLRNVGVTVRKTIDTLIATRCIESEYYLAAR